MIKSKVIVPRGIFIDPAAFTRVLETALDMVAEDIRIDFNVTTQTWKDRPDFVVEKRRLARTIFTDSPIYKFISRGTRVRYAIMSKNFRAKTVVGQIKSRAGRGGLVFIDIHHPRPGIEARRFEEVIWEKWSARIANKIQDAIAVEVRRQMSEAAKTTASQ